MYTESFCAGSDISSAKAVVEYFVKFNADKPEKNILQCKLTNKKWAEKDSFTEMPRKDKSRFSFWNTRLHKCGSRSDGSDKVNIPTYLGVYMSIFPTLQQVREVPDKYSCPTDSLCLDIQFNIWESKCDKGGSRQGWSLSNEKFFEVLNENARFVISRKKTMEVTSEECLPVSYELPYIEKDKPAKMDYRAYVKGGYDLRDVFKEVYMKQAVFSCIFHY